MPPRISTQLLKPHSRTYSLADSSRTTLSCVGQKRLLATTSSSKRPLRVASARSNYHYPQKRAFHASSSSRASSKDPYEVLGVPKTASQADIKKRYYELARKHHPDTNKDAGSKDRFLEIQGAWDILSDEKKRAAYDQYGSASTQQGFDPNAFGGGGGNPFGAGFGGFHEFNFGGGGRTGGPESDLFESLFGAFGGGGGAGGRRRPAGPIRGEDLETSINISFTEAAKGTKKTVQTNPVVDCKSCTGSGLKQGHKRTTCHACHGSGTQTFVVQSGFQMSTTCTVCRGAGTVVAKDAECGTCDGVGKVKERRTVQVNVPAGVEDRMHVRIPGEGDVPLGEAGKPGDLLVRVNVAPSKVFRRQGTNLFHDARIPLHIALLGGKVRVPTLDGDVEVRVPSGTQHGEEAILKGRGVPSVRGSGTGDLYVAFGIQLPRSLTRRQREIIQQFADEMEGRSSATPLSSSPPPSSSPDSSSASPDSSSSTDPSSEPNDSKASSSSSSSTSPPSSDERKKKAATG